MKQISFHQAGCDLDMGDLVYEPPRDGRTLWEIGIPDRTAAEFYVPDPDPKYSNKLYVNHPDRLVLCAANLIKRTDYCITSRRRR